MDMADIHYYDNIGSYTLFHSSPEEMVLNLILFDLQTWLFTTTPERMGLYKVVVTFTTETGTESFTSEY
jgi:hypothetical protein